jgi:hypothetical protein
MFQLYQCTPEVDIFPLVLDSTIRVKASENMFGHGDLTGSTATPILKRQIINRNTEKISV